LDQTELGRLKVLGGAIKKLKTTTILSVPSQTSNLS